MTKVTRIAVCTTANDGKLQLLRATATPLIRLRHDVWRMFSGCKVWTRQQARPTMKRAGLTPQFYGVPYELWANAIEDTLHKIDAWREATIATSDFNRFVFQHVPENDRHQVFLEAKKYKRVHSHAAASRKLRSVLSEHARESRSSSLRLVLSANSYDTRRDDSGRLWIAVATNQMVHGRKIRRVRLNLGHFPHDISGTIQLIIRDDDRIEVHVPVDAEEVINPNRRTADSSLAVGVDSGMTEIFATSDGEFIGTGYGQLVNDDADRRRERGRARGHLYSLAEKHTVKAAAARESGDLELARHHEVKIENIRIHNLTKAKITRQSHLRRARCRTMQFQAVHDLCDFYDTIVAESLDIRGKGKRSSRRQNNRMSSWQRSSLKEALVSVTGRRGSALVFVNPAYTSQWLSGPHDHFGVRVGDTIYCDTEWCEHRGDRRHADINAALNILERGFDSEVTIGMTPQQVKPILLSRMRTNHPRHENWNDGECGSAPVNPCANHLRTDVQDLSSLES